MSSSKIGLYVSLVYYLLEEWLDWFLNLMVSWYRLEASQANKYLIEAAKRRKHSKIDTTHSSNLFWFGLSEVYQLKCDTHTSDWSCSVAFLYPISSWLVYRLEHQKQLLFVKINQVDNKKTTLIIYPLQWQPPNIYCKRSTQNQNLKTSVFLPNDNHTLSLQIKLIQVYFRLSSPIYTNAQILFSF